MSLGKQRTTYVGRRVRRADRRRRRGRRTRLLGALGFAVLAAVLVLGALWPWVGGQARAAVVLSAVLEAPLATPLARAATGEPRVEEKEVAGNPTSVFVPAGEGPYPTVVFVNGAVLEGRRLPAVRRLGDGLARAGYLTVVPDLPGLTSDAITAETTEEAVEVALAVTEWPEAEGGRIGLVGGSTGATLAILAAEDPRLSRRVRAVAGVAPYADIRTVISLGTTGHYELDGRFVPYEAEPFLSYAVARSLISALPPGEDRERLLDEMRPIPRDAPDPLGPLRERRTDDLGLEARSVVELIANTDPERFEELYAELPAGIRHDLERLSPIDTDGRVRAPVEIVTGPQDRYFPVTESYELERLHPDTTVTVTGVLDHYMPRVSPQALPEFVKLNNFAVRSLHDLRAADEPDGAWSPLTPVACRPPPPFPAEAGRRRRSRSGPPRSARPRPSRNPRPGRSPPLPGAPTPRCAASTPRPPRT